MRIIVEAIAQDVHLNQKFITLEFDVVSVFRKGCKDTDKFNEVTIQIKPREITLDISDGFNPFTRWGR